MAIAAFALGQELDAAGDVVVHVAGAVHFDRDVVGDVGSLEYPGDEVRLAVTTAPMRLSILWKSFRFWASMAECHR